VVNFLIHKFDEGYSLAYLNTFRSAISNTAPAWLDIPLGQVDMVVRCMAQIGRLRPIQPAYESTWDMDILVEWLITLPTINQMDNKSLRMVAIILFKMVDLSRSADVVAISFKSLRFSQTQMSGSRRPVKTRKADRQSEFFLERHVNPKLCVVLAWEEYYQRTKASPRKNDQVFISHGKKVKEIGSQTIAKDTMKAMELAGINVDVFKSHSTRMAAASKALDRGASVDEVMRAGRWKSRGVFDTFYNRAKKMDMGKLILTGN
jgi:hypothetical protein